MAVSWPQRLGLVATCVISLVVGSVGLTDDAYASAGGDMARYVMNGVYVHDLLMDRPFGSWADFTEYTRLYYARYPALSLGHHPVLLAFLEAPLFAVFGMSITTARLVPLFALVIAGALLHGIVNRRYGPGAALAAALLLVTSPVVVAFSRMVMAELPSIALVVASAYFLERYCATARRSMLAAASAAIVLAIYAKPQALLVAPALLGSALLSRSTTWGMRRDLIVAALLSGVAAAPAVAVPLLLSPSNVQGVVRMARFESTTSMRTLIVRALVPQLALPVLVAAAVGGLRGILRRDRASLLFLLWIASVAPALHFFGGLNDEGRRYTLYWVPALCALAGSLVAGWRSRLIPALFACVLAVGCVLQAADRGPVDWYITRAGGYEEAARFVLASNPGPAVLFSGDVDTGYFSFFVRKHDPSRRLVVLRSDKLYTTSLMERPSVADRIERADQVYPLLHEFGVRYVVLEDRPSASSVLEMLRRELASERFTERRRIPTDSTDPRLVGTSLVVYELTDPAPANERAVLSMDLPLVGQSLAIPFRDLLGRKYLR